MFKSLLNLICLFLILGSCQKSSSVSQEKEDEIAGEEPTNDVVEIPEPDTEDTSFILPEIDLSNWKVTLPIGRPDEVKPPEILEYATNEKLKPFMYNDSIEGALVFYTYPGATTANSSRSRTELREQMEPGSNSVNWTFSQGGRLKGTLAMDDISKDSDDKYHRTIIMQIHGRLTNEQRDLIGQKDNNAPPMLKIYWQNGEVRVKTKVLKDPDVSNADILRTDSWTDDEGFNFNEEVGFDKFSLEVLVSDGRMEVILNDTESVVYEGDDIKKWGIFENYFKAGNYLQTSDEGSYARVKYYDLLVEH
ncbi:polysaccharide lyase family 7 protein [Flagellimonas hymeniacidonis]|uniref:Polysaccharide lyase family 7 protein n=1 Tax=Flagellimonas hymeniacidonis TaxID=2603628 RepID=A0A5C8V2C0_9FLAO|nr:polysaccharide lyase family 7 protein [Flagellimonas hymeniacidonis]TXN35232.1 polysaccharide lyase family 7 protein [Flagellimonas hymeniacidonis]